MNLIHRTLLVILIPGVLLAGGSRAGAQTTKGVEPPPGDGPVVVTTGIHVLDIARINEIDNVYTLEMDIEESWMDPRMGFAATGPGTSERIYLGVDAERQLDSVWWPNLGATKVVGAPSLRKQELRIRSDGKVTYRGRLTGSLKTPLDFREFPFDRQTLVIELESFSWDAGSLQLRANDELTRLSPDLVMAEWEVEAIRSRVSEVLGDRATPFSRLTVEIEVERKSSFYLWKVMLPILTIVAISWVVFWMTGEMLGRRASVSATAILTVIAYQFIVSATLPRVAYLTVMDRLILLSFITIAFTMIENMVVSLETVKNRGFSSRIDLIARFAFPLLYATGLLLIAGRQI